MQVSSPILKGKGAGHSKRIILLSLFVLFRECFLPASELTIIKGFTSYLAKVFPGGALFLACREDEFKLFLISQTTTFLKKDNRRCVPTTKKIERNVLSATQEKWIFSTQARVD